MYFEHYKKKNKLQLTKLLTIFILAGVIYIAIEVLATAIQNKLAAKLDCWKYISLMGYSSIWMFFVGGMAGILLGLFNEIKLIRRTKMIFQAMLGCLFITGLELLVGILLNIIFKLNIWHYEGLHFLHQINLTHSLLWFLLSPLAFWFDDYIRSRMYYEGEEYTFWFNYWKLIRLK